jgi:putative phosphoesterase
VGAVLVAAISDTHLPRGARRLPEACLEALRGAELVLHAGDISAASVLEELRALGPPVHAVHGNVDEPLLQRTLPAELVVEAAGARIGLRTFRGRRPDGTNACAGVSPAATPSSTDTPTCRSSRSMPAAGS